MSFLNLNRQVISQLSDITKQNNLVTQPLGRKGILIDDFSNVNGWGGLYGGTKTTETVYCKNQPQGMRLKTNAGVACGTDKGINLDCSDMDSISFWVYVNVKANLKIDAVYLYFTNNGYTSYYSACKTTSWLTEGWNFIKFDKTDFTATGTIDWNTPMTSMRLKVSGGTSAVGDVTFSDMRMNIKKVPKVLVMMDDGFANVYSKMFPYYMKRNIPLSLCIIKNNVGTAGYLNETQLKEMYDNGCDILNHTTSHAVLTSLSDDQIISEITNCTNYLKGLGCIRSSDLLAYPQGGGGDVPHIQDVVRNLGIRSARGTVSGIQHTPIDNLYALKTAVELKNTTVLSDATNMIDKAITTGGVCIIFGHNIKDVPDTDSYSVSTSVMKGIADYIVSKNIQPITYSQLINSYNF